MSVSPSGDGQDDGELRRTWFEYLKSSAGLSSCSYEEECGHIHGFDRENDDDSDDGGFRLSMLQRITTQRVLDYSASSNDNNTQTLQTKLSSFLARHGPTINLYDRIVGCSPRTCLAAEFKRASPSKGLIGTPEMRAGTQAVSYAAAGADVVSVLTEERWFQGSLADLTEARLETTTAADDSSTSPPPSRPVILRKDFVITRAQILEAVAAGTDTVLLIVAVTPATLLTELVAYCRSLHMEPLVEVHAETELEVALRAGAKVIGVNNRNLHTFHLDPATTNRTADQLKKKGLLLRNGDDGTAHIALCSLSGMSTAEDVHCYREAGVSMVLIGETLMRAADPQQTIKDLCLDPADYQARHGDSSSTYTDGTQLVKICGITNPTDALVACQAGANLIGVIFADKSKRKVTVDQAKAIVDKVRNFGERTDRVDLMTKYEAIQQAGGTIPESFAQKARLLQTMAPSGRRPLVVGVFQNQSKDFVARTVTDTGLDLVQLHGSEGPDAARPDHCGGVPALRVVDIPVDDDNANNLYATILSSLSTHPLAILLDTTVRGGGSGGGTGKTFDHGIAQALQQEGGVPVIIAGGLNPDNVGSTVSKFRPWGVDVSSGTEQSVGQKDHDKVTDFVKNVRKASS